MKMKMSVALKCGRFVCIVDDMKVESSVGLFVDTQIRLRCFGLQCYYKPHTSSKLDSVVTLASSTFQMSFASNLYMSITVASVSKKRSTFALLKAVARPILVASGVVMERHGCLFGNHVNQSTPARSFSVQV